MITLDQAITSTIWYRLDWTDDLDAGQSIDSCDVDSDPELTLTFDNVDGNITSVYVANATGVVGGIYEITFWITIDNPDGHQRIDDPFTIRVRLVETLYK